MTDWIEHTTDTCPVDPETAVEVRYNNGMTEIVKAQERRWSWMDAGWNITHYRIITPAKPPEPEMTYSYPDDADLYAESRVRPEMNADAAAALKRQMADAYRAGKGATPITSHQPMGGHNLITLRLECLKLAGKAVRGVCPPGVYPAADDWTEFADALLDYVLNGSVDKA